MTVPDIDSISGGDVWGRLHRDSEALDEALGQVEAALDRAAQTAMWKTDDERPIHSALSDMLGGLRTVVDGIVDDRSERKEDV